MTVHEETPEWRGDPCQGQLRVSSVKATLERVPQKQFYFETTNRAKYPHQPVSVRNVAGGRGRRGVASLSHGTRKSLGAAWKLLPRRSPDTRSS